MFVFNLHHYNLQQKLSSRQVLSARMYLDDLRTAPDGDWVICRSSEEAKSYVLSHGCPQFISFDHDLGGSDTAMIFIHWLVDYDMDNDGQIIPNDFQYQLHSANPVGRINIDSYLRSYLGQRDTNGYNE